VADPVVPSWRTARRTGPGTAAAPRPPSVSPSASAPPGTGGPAVVSVTWAPRTSAGGPPWPPSGGSGWAGELTAAVGGVNRAVVLVTGAATGGDVELVTPGGDGARETGAVTVVVVDCGGAAAADVVPPWPAGAVVAVVVEEVDVEEVEELVDVDVLRAGAVLVVVVLVEALARRGPLEVVVSLAVVVVVLGLSAAACASAEPACAPALPSTSRLPAIRIDPTAPMARPARLRPSMPKPPPLKPPQPRKKLFQQKYH
jgi:hypothetical protein